ncbi:class I SAM-dependent methyltransferase [Nocardia sp. NPDC050710]|uniref:class I SAM-dependent methyltransferase n=1 Tax=Nocardia sp. NPDC050710 TaxID=3157220 RepID=UPI003400DB9A
MPDVAAVWQNSVFGAIGARGYDFVLDHPAVAGPAALALWGIDANLMYDAMDVINEQPDGSSLLDLPVGGGVALRRLDPERRVRYVAADISRAQLRMARGVAERHGLTDIEFVRADVVELPFAAAEFDLVVTFAGLHCMPDPAGAIAALARVLRPGGSLVGSCVVAGVRRRYDFQIRALQRLGVFGPPSTVMDLSRGLDAAGLTHIQLSRNGALTQFTAVKA